MLSQGADHRPPVSLELLQCRARTSGKRRHRNRLDRIVGLAQKPESRYQAGEMAQIRLHFVQRASSTEPAIVRPAATCPFAIDMLLLEHECFLCGGNRVEVQGQS